jgi:hypothetical protein
MPYSLPKVRNQALGSFYAWFERLSNEGKMRMGKRLEHEGKIVACGNAMTDGPFIESKETIGGYWFIQAESLEEAAEIARGNPGLDYGLILEVRPDRPQKRCIAEEGSHGGKGAWNCPTAGRISGLPAEKSALLFRVCLVRTAASEIRPCP